MESETFLLGMTKVKPSPNGNNAGLHYRGMVNYEDKYQKK
jgi:hypothetical protein